MRRALLILLLGGSYAGFGQVIMKSNGQSGNKQVPRERIIAPGVYPLAPDNMPCVVPDLAKVKQMPNSINAGTKIQFMPNGYHGINPVVVAEKKKPAPPKKHRK